jgi:tetratricopeptide (TPR) repeat protein
VLTLAGLSVCAYWFSAPRVPRAADPQTDKTVDTTSYPFFPGLGPYRRPLKTESPLAQRYFDQGLAFLYGFNNEAAFHSFEAAAANDPQCAMAYWGIAMAHGPNINNSFVDALHERAGEEAAVVARRLSVNSSPVERSLIEAVGSRYAYPPPANRKPLDEAYAAAMRAVFQAHPDDADVGALAAEALMDLRPWNLWTRDGHPEPGTEEIIRILKSVLEKTPDHPFALHLFIHAVEASPHPEQADMAADRLRTLAPGLEHLLHVSSHIDVRCGRWQLAVAANERAVEAEKAYRRMIPAQGFYGYSMPHNRHMLAYAALMQGESRKATQSIQDMLAEIPEEALSPAPGKFDGLFAMPYELHLRFGRWNAMLAEPQPNSRFPVATTLWHSARGTAFAAKKQLDQAKAEQQAFRGARRAVPKGETILTCRAASVFDVAENMLAGEILYREGKIEEGIAALRRAVDCEDNLPYGDPPNWFLPARHALGATLLDAQLYGPAEAVYQADLARHPENGWSLYGLARSLQMQQKKAAAALVSARFKKSWRHADVALSSSCFCLQDKHEKLQPTP